MATYITIFNQETEEVLFSEVSSINGKITMSTQMMINVFAQKNRNIFVTICDSGQSFGSVFQVFMCGEKI